MALLNEFIAADLTPTLTLGNAILSADAYRLNQKRPAQRTVRIDGSHAETMLDVLPCTLVVEGRCLSTDHTTLRQTLRKALEEMTPFDFTFDGMLFSQMTVREYLLQKHTNEAFHHVSVTFCGHLTGEEMVSL